jgi:N-carbamoylputrescine amidase
MRPRDTDRPHDREAPGNDTHAGRFNLTAEPNGQVMYRASVEKEEAIVRELDLEKVEFAHTHWPFLRDQRINAYGGLVKRFADQTS